MKKILYLVISLTSIGSFGDSIFGASPSAPCTYKKVKQSINCKFSNEVLNITFEKPECSKSTDLVSNLGFNTDNFDIKAELKINNEVVENHTIRTNQPIHNDLYNSALIICSGTWDDYETECKDSTIFRYHIYPYSTLTLPSADTKPVFFVGHDFNQKETERVICESSAKVIE